MAAPDARTRNKISLKPTRVLATSIPSNLIPQIFLTNVLFVAALYSGKEWMLDYDVDAFWAVMRVLACGGLPVMIWVAWTNQLEKKKTIEWYALGMSSVLLFVQQVCMFTALLRLSPTRVILFTHFSSDLLQSFVNPISVRKALAMSAALFISLISDASEKPWSILPAYGALTIHSFTSNALEHTQGILIPSLGAEFVIAASAAGAAILALPLYTFRTIVLGFPDTEDMPLLSLAAIPLLAYSLLFLSPSTSQSLRNLSFASQYFMLSYPSTFILIGIVAFTMFSELPTWTDLLVCTLLYYGMYPQSLALGGPPSTPTSRLIKLYLKTILSNPESRKIFYFLMLNMCYMLVQMLYGVWTNSLGLISDAIHMAFDCMAIGVGLFASVMATWSPNERFTYGYGRIETLSGFANGIFLILISIFIVFEAIQRLLEPPEMNTSQLLLVSSLGLGVNLFGMFAMGGHHHHGGHSHSHDLSHSHADSQPPSDCSGHSPPHSHLQSQPSNCSHSRWPSVSPKPHSHAHSHTPSFPQSPSTRSGANSPTMDSTSHILTHDGHSHSHSPIHTQLHDGHSEHHSHSLDHDSNTHRNHLDEPPAITKKGHRRNFHGPSLRIDGSQNADPGRLASSLSPPGALNTPDVFSPITPSYDFGYDDHYDTHHKDHTPNLNKPLSGHHQSHEGHSHNMRGVFLHVMADTLGSVGVIISTLLIQLYGWTGFDPIASLFIAVLIAASVIPLVVDTGKILCLDVGERDVSIQQALSELDLLEGLASYSLPRFWPKDANSLIGSIHVQLEPSAATFDPSGPHLNKRTMHVGLDRVVEKVDTLLRSRIPGLDELTIQVEAME